jgi:hypothetical protein
MNNLIGMIQFDDRRVQADSILNFIFMRLIGYILTILIIIIAINNRFKISFGLIPIIAFEIFSLIMLCAINPKPKDDFIYLFMFENFMNSMFYLSILIVVQCRIDLVYILILPCFHLLVNLMNSKYQVSQMGLPLFFMNNLVFYVCTLFLVMKIINLLDESVWVCFWPFYLEAVVIFILVLKNIFEFFRTKLYLVKCFKIVAFKLSIAIVGPVFLGMHILAIYLLGSILFII